MDIHVCYEKESSENKEDKRDQNSSARRGEGNSHVAGHGSGVSSTNVAFGPRILSGSCTAGGEAGFFSTLCTFSTPHESTAFPPTLFTPRWVWMHPLRARSCVITS